MIRTLSKRELVDETYLRLADTPEVRTVIHNCARQRLSNGKALSKDKNIGATGDIPPEIYWNPRCRFIFHNADPVEREYLTRLFLEVNHRLKTTDRRLI